MDKPPYFRVSVRALIFDDAREKFLMTLFSQEKRGKWALLGGGIDEGESPHDALQRELHEEAGLRASWISEAPVHFSTGKRDDGLWAANVVYEARLEHLDFVPSNECADLRFVSPQEVASMDVFENIKRILRGLGLIDSGM